MRRRCAWCGKHLGFKCPVCGGPALELPLLNLCFCLTERNECKVLVFEPEGTTDGVCPECAAKITA